jgi:hypothetical protein
MEALPQPTGTWMPSLSLTLMFQAEYRFEVQYYYYRASEEKAG